MLGVEPANAAVFEDALVGVAAGRAGKFGFVVGVDRVGQADELREHGADVVVKDLADLLLPERAGSVGKCQCDGSATSSARGSRGRTRRCWNDQG